MGLSSSKPESEYTPPVCECGGAEGAVRAANHWHTEAVELRIAAEMSAVDISVLIKQNDELRAEDERLRAVVDAARQLREARRAMMRLGWEAHEQDAVAMQALFAALIALDGA